MSTITAKDMNQSALSAVAPSRRDFLTGTAAALTLDAALSGGALAQSRPSPLSFDSTNGSKGMRTITTHEGVEIFYKDWGPKNAQPIVFHHGWPLSADDWDAIASGPFYSCCRPGAEASRSVIENWWRQSMMGSAKAHYDGIKAFSGTDVSADLKSIKVPTLVMHGDDDQIVPIADCALLSAKLLITLEVYERFPQRMCTTHSDVINPALLAFIKS